MLFAAMAVAVGPSVALAQPLTLASVQATNNWSGYVATNAYYTGVTALIQAPLPTTYQFLGTVGSWVGIGGSLSTDLIQAGVDEINQGPRVSYQAWYELLPAPSRNIALDVQPGAWVLIDIHELAYNRWQITIVNGTDVFQQEFVYASSHSSAEWIVEEPAVVRGQTLQLLPLAGVTGANFTKMSAIANGKPALPVQLFPQPLAIVAATSLRALPTSLGVDGASFSVATVGTPF